MADIYWVVGGTDTNWSSDDNWNTVSGGGGVAGKPGAADTAIFNGDGLQDCVVDMDVSITAITIDAAYVNNISHTTGNTMTLAGAFTMAGGEYSTNDENFTVDSIGQTGGVLDLGASTVVCNACVVNVGTLSMDGATATFTNFTLTAGTVGIGNSTFTCTNFVLTLGNFSCDGATIVCDSFTHTAGKFTCGSSNIRCNGNWTFTDGNWNYGTSTVDLVGVLNLDGQGTSKTMKFYNVSIGAGGAATVTLTGNLTLLGTLSIAAGSELICGNKTITIGWGVTNAGTFTYNTSSVVLDTDQTAIFVGDTSFYDLTCSVPGKCLRFTAGSTTEIRNILTLAGSLYAPIVLLSSTPGTVWTIDNHGDAEVVSYVEVSDSTNTGGAITASTSWDKGNNTLWTFTLPDHVYKNNRRSRNATVIKRYLANK